MNLPRMLKRAAFQTSKSLGVFGAVRALEWRRRRLCILCYHGIAQRDEHEWSPELFMPPDMFEARLKILRDGGYSVLPLGEAVQKLYAGTLPPSSVAITFDDGFVDFYRIAYPLLRSYGFPATVYLTTYYSDFNKPIFNLACRYMLWRQRHMQAPALPNCGWNTAPNLSSDAGRARAWQDIERFVTTQQLSGQEKDSLAARIAAAIGFNYEEMLSSRLLHLMRPSEAEEVGRSGKISVELHTHCHRTPEDEVSFKREIVNNRTRIERVTGTVPSHFCYPSGVTRPPYVQWLQDLSVRTATTCEPGLAASMAEPLLLPRFVDTTKQSALTFEAWVSGAAPMLTGFRSSPAAPAAPRWPEQAPARSRSAAAR